MKKFNQYILEYKNNTLFPNLRDKEYEISMMYFIDEHKSKKVIDDDSIYSNKDEIIHHFSFETTCELAYGLDDLPDDVFFGRWLEIEIIHSFIDYYGIDKIKKESDLSDDEIDEILTAPHINGEDLVELVYDIYEFEEWYINSKYIDWYILYNDFYYNSLINEISNTVDGYINIYRSIFIDKDDDKHKKYNGVGVFWTYNSDNTESYNGHNSTDKHEIILKAKVDLRNVDWESTFNKSVYSLSEETEIQIKDYATVELLGYTLVDAISKYINIKTKVNGEQYKKLTKKTDVEILQIFREDADKKYNINLDSPIDILV